MKKFSFLITFVFVLTLFPISLTNATFSDTDGHENETAIYFLQNEGVLEGYADGTFQPERSINRAEFVKILVGTTSDFSETELKKCMTNYFSDTDADAWYTQYLCYAKEKNIINGYADGTFQPKKLINFAEASKIIANAQDLLTEENVEIWYKGFVEKLEENYAIPDSIKTFESNITRGQMAEILWRLQTKNQSKNSKRFVDLEVVTEDLPAITSCTDLKNKLQNGKQNVSYGLRNDMIFLDAEEEIVGFDTDEEFAPITTSVEKDAGSDEATDYSETNLQMEGVDEADVIKNDGKYIYMIKDDTVRIIEAYPPESMQEITKIELDDSSFSPIEIYTDSEQMIVIGRTYKDYSTAISKKVASIVTPDYYPYYFSNQTKVYIYDISDKKNPEKERSVTYEGSYNTSRKVDKNLYLVMNKSASFYEPLMYRTDVSDKNEAEETEVTNCKELVPTFSDSANDDTLEPMVDCRSIHYFPHFETPNYLIISAIDLSDTDSEISKELFLGSSENVYASKTRLYVATSIWNEEQITDDDDTYWKRKEGTLVYKFNLNGTDIEFDSKGNVPGRILNQFSMDEYDNHFRIATTVGESWDESNSSTNNLYILDSDMEKVGAIEDIAPGEEIYSVRFMGKRGFMVTFKTVDPLFVMDLSDPENPEIAGKLKIPGWSDYLHPYDENHLLGFGKEVDESIDADKIHSENAVYYTAVQGMKLSLFDISDLENPKEIFKEVIGDRGTTSEVLNNHKALLFNKEKELLAFPVTVMEDQTKDSECNLYTYSTCPSECQLMCLPSLCNENGACTSDCGDVEGSCVSPDSNYGNIQTVFQGAYIYTINSEDGFTLRGKISHYDDDSVYEKSGGYFYGDHGKNIQRIIYIGEYLYSISQDVIKSATLDDVEVENTLEVE